MTQPHTSEPAMANAPQARSARDAASWLWLLIPVLLVGFSGVMAVVSRGFLESDELSHFLWGRAMVADWKQGLDIWARPACTGLYGLAGAVGGLIGARLAAVGVTALTAWGTVRLAGALGIIEGSVADRRRLAALACLLLWAQPWFVLNSFTVMTEMLLACAWVWAAVMLAEKRLVAASLFLGLGGLARPEAWFAIAAWPLFLPWWSKVTGGPLGFKPYARAVGLAGLPVLAWYGVGLAVYANWAWPVQKFPWQVVSQYGKTGHEYWESLAKAIALWIWLAMLAGVIRLGVRKQYRGLVLLAVPLVCFWVLHAFLATLGLMGSMALPRYHVCVGPLVAVLALAGWRSVERVGWLRVPAQVVLVGLAIWPVYKLMDGGELPTRESNEMRQMDVAIAEVRKMVPGDQVEQRVIASDPYISYAFGFQPWSLAAQRGWDRESYRTALPGTVIIIEENAWLIEGGVEQATLVAQGWVEQKGISALVDAVPPRWDRVAKVRRGGNVRVWVREAGGATTQGHSGTGD